MNIFNLISVNEWLMSLSLPKYRIRELPNIHIVEYLNTQVYFTYVIEYAICKWSPFWYEKVKCRTVEDGINIIEGCQEFDKYNSVKHIVYKSK